MQNSTKTEILIFWGTQCELSDKAAYVFKRDYLSQDQILIVFYCRGSGIRPNKGSKMQVTYCLDPSGYYRGTTMKPLDQGAYD